MVAWWDQCGDATPLCVPEWVVCLAIYPGRLMVGEMGSMRRVSCTHIIGV